jgi:hypothetical protein
MSRRLLGIIPLLALLGACGDVDGSHACPAYIAPALDVRVVDAETDAVLNAGATGWWVTGSYAGTLELQPDFPEYDFTVYGPSGRYSLVVQHAGYLTWGRDDIRVTSGQCTVNTTQVLVELTPDAAVGGS